MPADLHTLTIHEAASLLRRGDLSSVALTESVLDRIVAVDNDVKAYLALTPEAALADAAAADALFAASNDPASLPALLGIPIAVKDVIDNGLHFELHSQGHLLQTPTPTLAPPILRRLSVGAIHGVHVRALFRLATAFFLLSIVTVHRSRSHRAQT